MARLLQNANNPGTNTGSWSGMFSCCFGKPKHNSPINFPGSKENTGVDFNVSAKKSKNNQQKSTEDEVESVKGSGKAQEQIPKHAAPATPLNSLKKSSSQDPGKVPEKFETPVEKHQPKAPSEVGSTHTDSGYRGGSKPPSIVADGSHAPIDAEAMYKNWSSSDGQKKSASRESIPLSVIATRKRDDSHTESDNFESHDFKEEEYNPKETPWHQDDTAMAVFKPLEEKRTILHVHIKFEFKTSELKVEVNNVENAPTKDKGGASWYQLRIAIIGAKKKHWHTQIVSAPDPNFKEQCIFTGLAADEIAKSAIRYRLYACDKMRRHFVFAESTIAFTSINLQQGAAYPVVMESRIGKSIANYSDSETDSKMSSAAASAFGGGSSVGGRSSIRSKLGKMGDKLHRPSSRHSAVGGGAASVKPETTRAEMVAKTGQATWPELQCGLSFDEVTKRLNVNVLRVNRLKAPETTLGTPKTFVTVTLMTKTGEKMSSAKTKVVKLMPSTEFGEQFGFDMSASGARDVMVFFRIFHKHKVHKDVNVGWFAMGCNNTGEEERDHWNEMLGAHGKEITRWHVLNDEAQ